MLTRACPMTALAEAQCFGLDTRFALPAADPGAIPCASRAHPVRIPCALQAAR